MYFSLRCMLCMCFSGCILGVDILLMQHAYVHAFRPRSTPRGTTTKTRSSTPSSKSSTPSTDKPKVQITSIVVRGYRVWCCQYSDPCLGLDCTSSTDKPNVKFMCIVLLGYRVWCCRYSDPWLDPKYVPYEVLCRFWLLVAVCDRG